MLGRILSTATLVAVVASLFYIFGDSQADPQVRFVLIEPARTAATEDARSKEEVDVVSTRDQSPAL